MSLTLSYLFFHLFVLVAFAVDLRKRYASNLKDNIRWSIFWFAIGISFSFFIAITRGTTDATTYLAAYVLEKSLSLDNVFVFWLIFQRWGVPAEAQHRVLMWGVMGAIFMRAIMITVGVKIIQAWHGVIVLFGFFLIATGLYTIATAYKPRNKVSKININPHRISSNMQNFWHDGKPTILLGALVCIEWSDVVFAIDSVPAIFGLTQDAFIIYTSNVLAILGLRSLYDVIQHATRHIQYLPYGIGLILTIVGLKMLGIISLSALQAVTLTLAIIGASFLASWFKK